LTLFTLFLLRGGDLTAQALNNQIKDVVMPSPNAASLGKYGDIPVSYHTGVPNVGIPIYTLQEGPISLPVSLSYHAGGVKVGEPCSWVGLNWSLQAGGMISRMTQGLPDERSNGYMWTGETLTKLGLTSTITPTDLATGAKDGEPDIFSFSVGGYSGKFYIGTQTNASNVAFTGTAIVIPRQDVKIEYFIAGTTSSADNLKKFKITTPEGVIYEFGNTGIGTAAIEYSQAAGFFPVANGWYLKRITSPDLASTIDLTYTAEFYRQFSKKSPGSTESSSSGGGLGVIYTDYEGWRINTITTSGAGVLSPEKVTFIAGSPRTDILQLTKAGVANTGNEAKTLASIKIENGTTECKSFVLSQSYWLDNSALAFVPKDGAGVEANYRLRLNSIQEQSCSGTLTTLPETKFTYYQSGSLDFLPHRYSSAIDHWGYYNGATTNPVGGFNIPYTRVQYNKTQTQTNIDVAMGSSNRETDEASMKLGTLQTITYPTGGNTTFEYEANDYYNPQGIKVLNDIPSGTTGIAWDGGNCGVVTVGVNPIIKTFTAIDLPNVFYKLEDREATYFSGGSCDVTPSYQIKVFVVGGSTTPVCVSPTITPSTTVLSGLKTSPPQIYEKRTTMGKLTTLFPCLVAGTNYRFEVVGTNSAVNFTLKQEVTVGTITNRKVGGLRVKTITSNDAVNVANNIVKTYSYNTDGTTPAQSSAVLYSIPTYSATYDAAVKTYQANTPTVPNFAFHVFTDYSIVPLSSFEGATVGYSSVRETLSNGAYTKYTYFQEGIQSYAGTPVPPTQPRIEAGNLSAKYQVNSSGSIVASEINTTYTGDFYEFNRTFIVNSVPTPDKYFKAINHTLVSEGPTAFFLDYAIKNKAYRLSKMESTVDGVTTTSNYFYDNNIGRIPKTSETVTNSNGTVTTTDYFYANNTPNAINAINEPNLIARNMIGFPIQVKQQTGTSVKWSRVRYKLFNTTQIEPEFLEECFETMPVNWITRLQISAYTTSGMPLTVYKNNFTVPEAYTWNNKLLTQKIFGNIADRILTSAIVYKTGTSLVEKITDENGLVKKYTYDPLMRLSIVQDRMDASGNNTQATTNYSYQYKDISNLYNYIGTSTTFVNATNTTPLSTKQYMDGLGRPVSMVRELYTPSNLNQKNNMTYDALGRPDKSYLPFEGTGGYQVAPALTPNSYVTYELSPLSRPLRQYAEDGKFMETEYGTNDGSVNKYTAVRNTDGSNTVTFGSYAAGSLFRTSVFNENKNGSIVSSDVNVGRTDIFKDKLGRVVLTRKWLRNGTTNFDAVDTYNVYDDYNNLVMVIPPGAYLSDVALLFQYNYDTRNRLIRKKVPNSDWVNFYYDARDLLVMTQDGNMRVATASATSTTVVPKFLATQYDEIGRVVKTGFTTTAPIISTSGNTLGNCTTDIAATITDRLTETQYYSNRTWVKHQAAKVLKPTGVTTEREYLWSYIERRVGLEYTGNPVWTGKQHLLSKTYVNGTTLVPTDAPITDNDVGGVNWTISGYDGAQKPTLTINYLFSGPNTTQAQEVRQWQTFNYDNGQRLQTSNYTYALNGAGVSSPTFKMSDIVYNVRNQVIEKNTALVGSTYLQSTDFEYNNRGWLTAINSGFAAASIDYPLFASTNSAQSANYATLATTGFRTPAPNSGENNPDLFKEIIRYDNPNTALPNNGKTVIPQYNGNISQMEWQVAGREAQAYTFNYDNLERLTEANYTDIHASDWSTRGWLSQYEADNKYKESATYDFRGNIVTMNRNGKVTDVIPLSGPVVLMGIFTGMDALNYTYDATDKNKLMKVAETAFIDKGFKTISTAINNGATHYTYDTNGNLTSDVNKGITGITYNHLNLPQVITFTNNASAQPRRIEFIYDATGVKLRKTIFVNNIATDTTSYINGIEYKGLALSRFAHTEGAVVRQADGTTFLHEYTIKDHLGNARVTYSDANNDGLIGSLDIKQINSYYPFGMNMEGNYNGAAGTNKYQFNGKEWNDDFGLGWNHHDWRFYDVAIGRFVTVDRLPEEEDQEQLTPYQFAYDSPIRYNDPDGQCPTCVIGAFVGAGVEVASQLASGKSLGDIDLVDVAVEGAKGFIKGSGVGLAASPLIELGGEVIKAAFDYSSNKGNENVLNGKKTPAQAGIDLATNVIGGKIADKVGIDKLAKTAEKAAGTAVAKQKVAQQAERISKSYAKELKATVGGARAQGAANGAKAATSQTRKATAEKVATKVAKHVPTVTKNVSTNLTSDEIKKRSGNQ
jgi:RHS repeat-associated protein